MIISLALATLTIVGSPLKASDPQKLTHDPDEKNVQRMRVLFFRSDVRFADLDREKKEPPTPNFPSQDFLDFKFWGPLNGDKKNIHLSNISEIIRKFKISKKIFRPNF